MKVKEAREKGYIEFDTSYARGYISRKTEIEEQELKIAGGNRKGELYYEKSCLNSSKYHFRVYMKAR